MSFDTGPNMSTLDVEAEFHRSRDAGALMHWEIVDPAGVTVRLHECQTDVGPARSLREDLSDLGLHGAPVFLRLSGELLLHGLVETAYHDGGHRMHPPRRCQQR